MILSKDMIISRLYHDDESERLTITPLDDMQIGRSSVDLRLSNRFIAMERVNCATYDPREDDKIEAYQKKLTGQYGKALYMHPHQILLGGTVEYLRLPYNLSGEVIGKSSWGRLGVIVATATRVWPKYAGILTLELINSGEVPVALYPGSEIVQMAFRESKVSENEQSRSDKLEVGKYSCSIEPGFSRLSDDPFWRGLREGSM